MRRTENPWSWASLMLTAVALSLVGSAVHCEEPAPTAAPLIRTRVETWTQHLFKAGEDRRLVFGARGQAIIAGPAGVHVMGRMDASAIPTDGGTPNVSLTDLSSAQSLELYGGAYRDVWGPFALAAIGGTVVPLEGGNLVAQERYARTFGAGVLMGDGSGNRWLLLAVGKHEAAGDGVKLLATGQWPITGPTSFVSDAAIGGQGSFVRFGFAVCLSGCQ